MTSRKHFKQLVRARMEKTGERYTAARAHVLDQHPEEAVAGETAGGGWQCRGGTHADTAALANVLANLGVVAPHTGEPLSEALVLGAGGGLGAGYILWEFSQHDARILVLGFRHSWQYPARWASATAERLGLHAEIHETGARRAAADRLDDVLGRGLPAILWADQQRLGYRHLPDWLDGHGGGPVVAVGADDGRVLLDDRGSAPLAVEREHLAEARARVGSYKHRLIAIDPALAQIDVQLLNAALTEGIRAQVAHLRERSDSFSLPAWRKWARLATDTRNKKGWPTVFADRRGLTSALVSIYQGAGSPGEARPARPAANLRSMYADFLDEAATLLGEPNLARVAPAWRAAAQEWQGLVDRALPPDHPELGRLRELVDRTERAVAGGESMRAEARAAAAGRWALQERLDREPPLDEHQMSDLLDTMSAGVESVFRAESDALEELASVVER